MVQTIGRAARNSNGKVIMYADRITDSMRKTIDETERRREKQIAYNTLHNIVPKTVLKSKEQIMNQTSVADAKKGDIDAVYNNDGAELSAAADPVFDYMTIPELEKAIKETEKSMMKAAKEMEFIEAARYRDQIEDLKKRIKRLNAKV
ncbi:MAG: UvrB/UvrC motif-containing protein [Chitinophagaceae bacterium]